MAKMLNMFLNGAFGTCPRALCGNQKCIPVGLSDDFGQHGVKIFCPKCGEVYVFPGYAQVDGAAFGQSFPQKFLTFNEVMVEQPPKVFLYEPQIKGFKLAGQRGSKYYRP